LNHFSQNDIDCYHSALAKQVVSIICTIKQHMPYQLSDGNSTIIFSTIQPFSVCEVFIVYVDHNMFWLQGYIEGTIKSSKTWSEDQRWK